MSDGHYIYGNPNMAPDAGDYVFPQNAYGYGYTEFVDPDFPHYSGRPPPPHMPVDGDDYGRSYLQPPQVGGGEYHARLRSTIKLSPNAPRTVQKAAKLRKEAVDQASRPTTSDTNDTNNTNDTNDTNNTNDTNDTNDTTDLSQLDTNMLASLTMDAGWEPSPPPPPAATAESTTGSIEDDMSAPSTPTPSAPVPSVDSLFTPVANTPMPSEEQESFKESVFKAMDFQPLNLPPPPSTSLSPNNPTPSSLDHESPESEGLKLLKHSKGGRFSKAMEKDVQELFDQVNALFDAASERTGRPVASLVDRWNNLSKYGLKGSTWNTYQKYYQSNTEAERKRAGILNGTASQCWESFKELPDCHNLLETFTELEHMEFKTIVQRQRVFKKLIDSYRNLAIEASRNRVESFVLIAGTSINEDSNLAHIQTSKTMETFIPEMLRMTPSEFTGLAKVHVYNKIANTFIEDLFTTEGTPSDRLAHLVASLGEPSSHRKRSPRNTDFVADGDEGDVTSTRPRSNDDERALCKTEFLKLFEEHGLKVSVNANGQENLPWSNLLDQLVTWGVQLTNWPTDVKFPSETLFDKNGKKCASKGIKKLAINSVRSLLDSFNDPKARIKINKMVSAHDLKSDIEPVIIKAPPTYESKMSHAKRQFASGKIDEKGPAALGPCAATTKVKRSKGKGTTGKGLGKPPPPQAEVLDISSSSPPSNRTRSRVRPVRKTHKRLDSESGSDDDDNIPLVISKTAKPNAPKDILEVSDDTPLTELEDTADEHENRDSDPDGLLDVDPKDKEYDGQDEEWFAKKKSLERPGGNGKAKSKSKAKTYTPALRVTPAPSLSSTSHTPAPSQAIPDATTLREERIHQVIDQFQKGSRKASALPETGEEPSAKRLRSNAPGAPPVEKIRPAFDPSAMSQSTPKAASAQYTPVPSLPPLPLTQTGPARPPSRRLPANPSASSVPLPEVAATPMALPTQADGAAMTSAHVARPLSAQPSGLGIPNPSVRQSSRPPSTQPSEITPEAKEPPFPTRAPAPAPGVQPSYPPRPPHYLQGPPPGLYNPGSVRSGGPAIRGRPPSAYAHPIGAIEEDSGGHRGRGRGRAPYMETRGRGRGRGRGHIMHEDAIGPYHHENYHRRPPHYDNKLYYSGFLGEDWDYDAYSYARPTYPPHITPSYGEAGPSRLQDVYNPYGGSMEHDGAGLAPGEEMEVDENWVVAGNNGEPGAAEPDATG